MDQLQRTGADQSPDWGAGQRFSGALSSTTDITCILRKLFERVENKHGWMLVSHALAYLTASKNGISEPEIEDLISLDDRVLDDIYQYHLPPTRFGYS